MANDWQTPLGTFSLVLEPFGLIYPPYFDNLNESPTRKNKGTRESLINAAIDLAFYDPPYVDDWVTYRRAPQDYAPSLNDNDNPVYQNLYRLQAQAIDYIDSRNAGAYYNEWSYFERGCGFTEE